MVSLIRGFEPIAVLGIDDVIANFETVTADFIAAADGGFDAEERKAVICICKALGLDPATFDIADAPRKSVATATRERVVTDGQTGCGFNRLIYETVEIARSQLKRARLIIEARHRGQGSHACIN